MMQGSIFDGKIFNKCAKYIAISDSYFDIKYATNTEVKNTVTNFSLFPYLFPYLCYLILSLLTPSSFQTRFRLITFIHASALLLTCLFLISFLYLPSPFFYINPVDYACKP